MADILRVSRNWVCLVFLAGACFGQNPAALFDQAPPDIDEALRARISKFYQAHVDGKFRAADEMVAEDSKDIFFAADKPHCKGFQIMTVKYSENFTRAVVVATCDTEMVMAMMAGRIPVKMPLRSLWKLADGQWFWYAEPVADKEEKTPFGTHKPAAPGEAGSVALPAAMTLEAVANMVKADRQTVRFDPSAAGTEQVKVTSQMPGSITLSIGGVPQGLTAKLDRTSLGQGESAVLSIHFEPAEGRKPVNTILNVVTEPMYQTIPIQVQFR